MENKRNKRLFYIGCAVLFALILTVVLGLIAGYRQGLVDTFTVTFYDESGQVLLVDGKTSQEVARNHAAVAPEDPGKNGYVFVGWDSDFSRVVSDMDIRPVFKLLVIVSLEERNITYGDPLPAYTPLYTAIDEINFDSILVADDGVEIVTDYAAGDDAGTYAVQASGLTSEVYVLRCEQAELIVRPKKMRVFLQAGRYTRMYGDDNPIVPVQMDGILDKDRTVTFLTECAADEFSPARSMHAFSIVRPRAQTELDVLKNYTVEYAETDDYDQPLAVLEIVPVRVQIVIEAELFLDNGQPYIFADWEEAGHNGLLKNDEKFYGSIRLEGNQPGIYKLDGDGTSGHPFMLNFEIMDSMFVEGESDESETQVYRRTDNYAFFYYLDVTVLGVTYWRQWDTVVEEGAEGMTGTVEVTFYVETDISESGVFTLMYRALTNSDVELNVVYASDDGTEPTELTEYTLTPMEFTQAGNYDVWIGALYNGQVKEWKLINVVITE